MIVYESQSPVGKAELEWLAATDIEAFVSCWPKDCPVTLIGGSAHSLARALSTRALGLRVDAVQAHALDESMVQRRNPAEFGLDARRLASELTPKGSTVVLDPCFGHWLVENPKAIEAIALKTFDRLLLPVFVKPQDWVAIFSDEFSFEEPVGDDASSHRWCWCISEKPGLVLIQGAGALVDHRLKFTLTSTAPGTFVCRVGDQQQVYTATVDRLTAEFSFFLRQSSSLVAIEIVFSGTPLLQVGQGDQRKALYYSFSGVSLEESGVQFLHPGAVPAPNAISFLSDRTVRRVLHANGFFEVRSLVSPWRGLAALCGVRSTYDYQCGFSYRDTDPRTADGLGRSLQGAYAFPAIWYQARRTPTPGIEWIGTRERLEAVIAARQAVPAAAS